MITKVVSQQEMQRVKILKFIFTLSSFSPSPHYLRRNALQLVSIEQLHTSLIATKSSQYSTCTVLATESAVGLDSKVAIEVRTYVSSSKKKNRLCRLPILYSF